MTCLDKQMIAGALECIKALSVLEHFAENLPAEADEPAGYLAVQSEAAEILVKGFGPMTPRQQGAFRALVEYIHVSITAGRPKLDVWRPVVSVTPKRLACGRKKRYVSEHRTSKTRTED